jgi:hypothetical protein
VKAEEVETSDDLIEFIAQLRTRLAGQPDWWENNDSPSYLEAFQAWTAGMDGYFINQGERVPTGPSWSLIAIMLEAAAMYE